MKKILTTLLCAVLFCTATEAQQDVQVKTVESHDNFYVIDGKHVENFDGSQLVGKTIKHYDMKVLPNTIIHNIFTTDDWVKIEGTTTNTMTHVLTEEEAAARGIPMTSSSMKAFMHNPLIIVDGEEYNGNLSEITEKMDYIDVYNPDDEVAKSYGEKGKNGVMKIYTKKQDDAIVYIVNGKIASKEDFNKLVPESIKKIKVLKRGTAAAMKVSTDGDTHDVYMVTTK